MADEEEDEGEGEKWLFLLFVCVEVQRRGQSLVERGSRVEGAMVGGQRRGSNCRACSVACGLLLG